MSRKLTSGVYFVPAPLIEEFKNHATEYGWRRVDENWSPLRRLLREGYIQKENKEKAIIPFSLDKNGTRVGYWSEPLCYTEAQVLTEIEKWSDWNWTEKHIELYKPLKLLL